MGKILINIFIIVITLSSCHSVEKEMAVEAIIGRQKVVFPHPPSRIPVPHSVDAPFLGNGFTGIALSGHPEKQVYYIARNDFWRLKSSLNQSYPAVLGKLEISIPALKGATYLVEQNLYEAKTHSTFVNKERLVQITSYVSATQDMMIIQVNYTGPGEIKGAVNLELPGDEEFVDNPPADLIFPAITQEGSTTDGEYYISRAFEEDVDLPTKAACAFTVMDKHSNEFKLSGGTAAIVLLAFSSNFKSEDCLQTVIQQLQVFDPDYLPTLEMDHKEWWKQFWSKSFVEISDSIIEKQYYLSNYNLACFSRDKDFPPSIFGSCITMERPYWNGDYHLNYNHMAPYYGLFSSNHIEQALPCNMPILAARQRGEYYSRKICGIEGGILLPVGIGPLGIETTRKNQFAVDHRSHWIEEGSMEDEGLFFGQKSNSSYCIVNMANHFYTTYDEEYIEMYYPFVKGVATFWEDYLEFEDGRYVIYNDAIHEGTIGTKNPILSLGLIRMVMQTAIDMSEELMLDQERVEKWQHIIDHLPEYTYQEREGKSVFRYSEQGTDWWGDNTLGIQHIYPAGQIGMDSDPELIQVARNTINVMQRWIDFNGSNSFFPAAVRVGYHADTILENLRRYCENTNPNGFQLDNPHGIENLSTVPNTVNEMLCMGFGNILRVFPVWPKNWDARFHHLRKEGAFLVSGELENGKVQFVEIFSEKGRDCHLLNPWPDQTVVLTRPDGTETYIEGTSLRIKTQAGENLLIKPVS